MRNRNLAAAVRSDAPAGIVDEQAEVVHGVEALEANDDTERRLDD